MGRNNIFRRIDGRSNYFKIIELISKNFKPSDLNKYILKNLVNLLPTLPIVPTTDIKYSETDKNLIQNINNDIFKYKKLPRLKTAFELYDLTTKIDKLTDKNFQKMPILILHGKNDKITDSYKSENLFSKLDNKYSKLHLLNTGRYIFECELESFKIINDWIKIIK